MFLPKAIREARSSILRRWDSLLESKNRLSPTLSERGARLLPITFGEAEGDKGGGLVSSRLRREEGSWRSRRFAPDPSTKGMETKMLFLFKVTSENQIPFEKFL